MWEELCGSFADPWLHLKKQLPLCSQAGGSWTQPPAPPALFLEVKAGCRPVNCPRLSNSKVPFRVLDQELFLYLRLSCPRVSLEAFPRSDVSAKEAAQHLLDLISLQILILER